MDTKLIRFAALFVFTVSPAIAVDAPKDMPVDRRAPDGPPPARGAKAADVKPAAKAVAGKQTPPSGLPVAGTGPKGAAPTAEAGFRAVATRKMRGSATEEWITVMRKKLPMIRRDVGPFGLTQNPDEKVAVVKVKPKAVRSPAFTNAVHAIPINLVNSAAGRFAVGSREFKEGDVFPIERAGKKFMTKVVDVRMSYIVFKDVNNGEQVKRSLKVLPEGMKKGKLEDVEGIQENKPSTSQPLKLP